MDSSSSSRDVERSGSRRRSRLKRTTLALVILAALATPLLWYGREITRPLRPPRTDVVRHPFAGITYRREARDDPRPMMIHVMKIDLEAPGIRLLVSPGDNSGGMDILAAKTSSFLRTNHLQVAINGSFCKPAHHKGSQDYYPHSGDPVDVIGLAISNGTPYSTADRGTSVLCVSASNHASIELATCPPDTDQSLAGWPRILEAGQITKKTSTALAPRTAVAVDASGKTLWFIVVDGRQTGYSHGATYTDLGALALELGASDAVNLDGGGSSTMVEERWYGSMTLNAPIHLRVPMLERPVANHIGVFASPAP